MGAARPAPAQHLDLPGKAVALAFRRYRIPPHLSREDAEQEARLALVGAARRWDPAIHGEFRPWVYRRCEGAVIDWLRREGPRGRYDTRPELLPLQSSTPAPGDLEQLAEQRARLSSALDRVAGHRSLSPRALRRILAGASPPARVSRRDPLSPRQLQVLALAAAGYTAEETGERLGISVETVKSHRRAILPRLGARNISHAVHLAHERGLLPPGEEAR